MSWCGAVLVLRCIKYGAGADGAKISAGNRPTLCYVAQRGAIASADLTALVLLYHTYRIKSTTTSETITTILPLWI